jgi:GNAT superfamily N-acetyltransferase
VTEPSAPPDELVIRPFRPDDVADLVRLNAYGLAAAGIQPTHDYYAGEDFDNMAAVYSHHAGGLMLVGEVRETIIAMGGIRRIDEKSCELLRMRVFPSHQHQGIATAILERLEHEAAAMGYHRIELITGEHQHPAVDMYRRHGYQVTHHESLIGIPSVHMAKPIDPA